MAVSGLLPFSWLANAGLAVGSDFGFNACECFPKYGTDTIVFHWVAHKDPSKEIRRGVTKSWGAWACSYTYEPMELNPKRQDRIMEFDSSLRSWRADRVREVLAESLLELQ